MINKLIANILPFMPKKLVWIFSKRYIAGEKMNEAIKVSRKLNGKNIVVTVDVLGEFIENLQEAEDNKSLYIKTIDNFLGENIQGNFSVKPSMFGLLIDKEICYNHIEDLVKYAAEKNSFIRIDMEDSQCVDDEIDIYKRLYKKYPAHVGLVLQAYLRRTKDDLIDLYKINNPEHPINFRLCKGIYVEPKEIAYKDYQEVRDHYLDDLDYMLSNNIYVGIATHDKYLVENAFKLIDKHNVPKDRYEFQMLYGVTPDLRQTIVDKDRLMRVYVPFGKHWFNYSTRRLKENPKMAQQIIKAIFVRG